ncbi:methionyl-tRNA formyltransferase [Aquihabitans daechungensis]|uniref:methionyl-tRNA formyltransferase n=1 Tax=Aquihabitans daechungensis TaxID=1052257 RepID=UPI003BA3A3B2
MDPAGAPHPALPLPPSHPRRLVFLGTPEMAVPPLRALHEAGFDVALVVTGADKRRGRGNATTPSPVKVAAQELGLEVSHDVAAVAAVGADLGVVVAFGQILRRPVLEALPMVNLHFSLLPRWRGAAPVERAILAGDERTGVCVMAVEEGLDTGGVYARAEVAIPRSSTLTDLAGALTETGSRLLVETLQAGLGPAAPQVGEPTYAHKLGAADRELRWDRTAEELDRVVRVGGAWTTVRGKRVKVLAAEPWTATAAEHFGPGHVDGTRVATGLGALELVTVQPEGKGAIDAADWLRGLRLQPGERLGVTS